MTLPDLGALLHALHDGGVDFVVVGGVAVAAHEYVRATEDVDFVPAPDPENLDRLMNVLVALDGRLTLNADRVIGPDERQTLHQGRNLSVSTRHGDADVIQRLPGVPPYEMLAGASIRAEIAGVQINVCSREHLIAMKEARRAAIDIADLERLNDPQS